MEEALVLDTIHNSQILLAPDSTLALSTEVISSTPEVNETFFSAIEGGLKYLNSLGGAIMMPIIFTILGVCIGIKFGKALKSGLLVGVGFVGLGIITQLLTDSLGPILYELIENYGLNIQIFDMGWPAAAGIAYNTSIGIFIIPVCLGVNLIMLLTRTTKTVNIDLWNYWHFAFIGALAYFATDNILWGFFAAIICYIITMIIADYTAPKFQKYYDKMDGISIPQPFCAGYVPFAMAIDKGLDKIPGINKIKIDAEGMKKKFGLLGEPLFLGVMVGLLIGICAKVPEIIAATDKVEAIKIALKSTLGLGIKMGAVMELIPRITSLFIEGLLPIAEATKQLIARKFKKSAGLNIGMSPALVIGHPTTLVVSLLLIPAILLLSVILPGNKFLPLASLAGLFYLFPLILPITKGNVFKTFIIGLIFLVGGVYIATNLAPYFTLAAHDVYAMTGDASVKIPDGFEYAASIDFAASPFTWIIFHMTRSIKIIGPIVLTLLTVLLMVWNRNRIVKQNTAFNEQEAANETDEIK